MGRLIIVCGVPGAGKSTLARHAVDRWNAVIFASESFASELGPVARNASGDLTPEAIAHAYSAMAMAAKRALQASTLVLTIGSFRAQEHRRRFRDMATGIGAQVTIVRISCSAEIAADRVLARRAEGENGPNEAAIRHISAELDRADDVELIISNDGSIELLCKRADALMADLSS
jgi:predicted kinase